MRVKTNLFIVKLFGCLAIIIALQSCKHKIGIWQNDKMNAGRRSDFHALNATVLQCLKGNRYKELQFSMSRQLLDDGEMIRTVEHISNNMADNSYSLLNEYYVVSKPETNVVIGERKAGINNFDIYFNSVAEEMYVAFFASKNPAEKWMITAMYAKYDYGWKLCGLTLNPYTTAGKTAPELYKLAQAKYAKGYLIDAVDLMNLAQTCYNPANEWQYVSSFDMNSFSRKIIDEANARYKFPYAIKQVKTHPQIIRVYNQKTSGGYFPMIYYLSGVSIKDTLAVKRENDEIKKVIGTIMPGIDKDKKYLMYAAFNERPNAKTSVDHFDMVDKLP